MLSFDTSIVYNFLIFQILTRWQVRPDNCGVKLTKARTCFQDWPWNPKSASPRTRSQKSPKIHWQALIICQWYYRNVVDFSDILILDEDNKLTEKFQQQRMYNVFRKPSFNSRRILLRKSSLLIILVYLHNYSCKKYTFKSSFFSRSRAIFECNALNRLIFNNF